MTNSSPVLDRPVDHPALDHRGFAALAAAGFLGPFAFTSLTPALSSIGRELHARGAAPLVLAAYGSAFAATLILGGRLGDAYGRRRALAAGLTLLAVASLAGAVTTSLPLLLAARVAQGAAAGLFFPQLLATVQATTEGDERLRRIAVYTAMLSLGVTGGQVVGGLLLGVPGLGWRATFVTLAAVAAAALGTVRHVPATGGGGERPDSVGGLLLVAGCGLLLAGLSLRAAAPAVVGLVLLVAFGGWSVRRERRGLAVLVSPGVVRVPAVALGCLAVLVFYSAFTGFLVSWSAYAEPLGGPAAGSTTFIVPGLAFMLIALSLAALVRRLGALTPLVGSAVQACALAALWWWGPRVGDLRALWWLVPVVTVMTIGNSLMYGPMMPVIMGGVPRAQAGMASGLFATAQQVAMALGSALFGALWVQGGDPRAHLRTALALMLAACAVYAVLAALLRRAQRPA